MALVIAVLLPPNRTIAGSADAAESIAGFGGTAAPVAIRHVGPTTATGSADDTAVAGVLTDLNTFWSATLPADFTKEFAPLTGGYVSIDSSADSGQSWCVTSPGQIAGNAYYCPTGDAIVYDSAGLIPVLLGHYGAAGLTAAFAHEFGHSIQARIGPTAADRTADPSRYPSILIEAQGDCFAGSFLAWAVAGGSAHVRLPASSMVRAVAPLLDFADPITTTVDDPTAARAGTRPADVAAGRLPLRSGRVPRPRPHVARPDAGTRRIDRYRAAGPASPRRLRRPWPPAGAR